MSAKESRLPRSTSRASVPLSLVEALGDLPGLVLDARGRIIHASPAAAERLGAPGAPIIGRMLSSLVTLPRGRKLRFPCDLPARAAAGAAPLRLLVARTRRDGFQIGLVLDNSELDQAILLRERILSSHRTFLQSVSHDLRVPLASAEGYASLLFREQYKKALGPDGAHFLERLRANIELLDEMLHHLLELSRVGAEKHVAKRVRTGAMIATVLEQFSQRIVETQAQIRVAPQLPDTKGHELQFRRVFQNLIDNALKFRGERPLKIDIGFNGHSFTVRDNGQGIPEALQAKIWEPFNKLDPSKPGAGIGLSLVKRIVEEFGGSIRLESRPAEGSTFFVQLPLA